MLRYGLRVHYGASGHTTVNRGYVIVKEVSRPPRVRVRPNVDPPIVFAVPTVYVINQSKTLRKQQQKLT